MPDAQVDGRTLHYERRGSGQPLLLIIGLSGTHRTWGEPFLDALAADFGVIAYDHRGTGFSGPIDGGFTIADLARDAAGLLRALELSTAHVLGISMGGMVAQELALAQPAALRTLTLGCSYAGGPGSRLTTPESIRRLRDTWSSGDAMAALRASFELNVSAGFAARPGSFREFAAQVAAAPVSTSVILEQLRATATHDTSVRLGSVRAPTLVLSGDEDAMLDVRNSHQIAALIPGARLETLPATGHMFWWEHPLRTAELVAEHARRGARGPQ